MEVLGMGQLSAIRQAVEQMSVIDTHEHIQPLGDVRGGLWDFIELCKATYVAHDFTSVAGSEGFCWPDTDLSAQKRFEQFEQWMQRVENTAYYRHLLVGCRKLYGVPQEDKVNADNFIELSEKMQQAAGRDDLFDYALGQVGNIQMAIQDPYWAPFDPDTGAEVLTSILRMDSFVIAPLPGQVDSTGGSPYEYARILDFEVSEFDDYLQLINAAIEHYKASGGIGIKLDIAYARSLDIENVSADDARRLFQRGPNNLSAAEMKALQDYLIHIVVKAAAQYGLPIQIHTGMLAGFGDVRGTNPVLLTDLITAHPKTNFVLFHGGYPYCSELTVMVKAMPNVYLDMCWLPIISPSVVRRMLQEWIETIPMTKLMWGGDCSHVEAALGALEVGKDIIARVMTAKVNEANYFTEDVALRAVKCILHDNAAELFLGQMSDES